jgi:hypothetical protein
MQDKIVVKAQTRKKTLKATGMNNCVISRKKLIFAGFGKYDSIKEIHGPEYFFTN